MSRPGIGRLTIAGVRFALSGLGDARAYPPAFQSFLRDTTEFDLECDVSCSGPDATLALQPLAPDKPWSFTVNDGLCEVVRRNQEGVPLWKISGPLSFNRATITWNPGSFEACYGSCEQAWGKGLGLSLLVLRLCARGGLAFHGTAAELDGQGILCVGISGTGKSTLARLLDEAGASVLTDERPVVRQWLVSAPGEAPFRVYGSPWPSSAGFARAGWSPLRRLYFLEHGETDQVIPLTPGEAVSRLIHVATIPWQSPALLDPCLQTVEALLRDVPCSVLAFRPTTAVVEVIRADVNRPAARVNG